MTNMIFPFKNARGLSLMGAMISAAMLIAASAAIATISFRMAKSFRDVAIRARVTDVVNRTQSLINDDMAWLNTINDPANANLVCLRNQTDCAGAGGTFRLLDSNNNIFFDPAAGATAGLDLSGNRCNSFVAAAGTMDCPIRADFSWTPICPPSGACIRPLAQISGNIQIAMPNGFMTMNLARIASIGGKALRTDPFFFYDISANATDVVFSNLIPPQTQRSTYIVTIESGVVLSASSTTSAAFSTGSLPFGSTMKIINKGSIRGAGGQGGNGAGVPEWNDYANSLYGQKGGPAIAISVPTIIDSRAGTVWGGGGGGAGTMNTSWQTNTEALPGGGGGGGGQGSNVSAGGVGGGNPGYQGGNGTAGGPSGPGTGGASAPFGACSSLIGGTGGTWGQDGASVNNNSCTGPSVITLNGGRAGLAVQRNGNSVIWEGGRPAGVLGLDQ